MAVMARDNWTDADLNHLGALVNVGFEEMRTDFKAVRAEMHAGSEALRSDIKEDIQALRAEVKEEVQSLRSDIKEDIQALRAEVKEEVQSLRGEVKEEFRAIRVEMGLLRSDMNGFHRSVIQLVWGIVGTVFLGFMGTIAALFSLV